MFSFLSSQFTNDSKSTVAINVDIKSDKPDLNTFEIFDRFFLFMLNLYVPGRIQLMRYNTMILGALIISERLFFFSNGEIG